MKIEDIDRKTRLTWEFGGEPQTFGAKVMSVFGKLFTGSTKKALQQDLEDIKKRVESM